MSDVTTDTETEKDTCISGLATVYGWPAPWTCIFLVMICVLVSVVIFFSEDASDLKNENTSPVSESDTVLTTISSRQVTSEYAETLQGKMVVLEAITLTLRLIFTQL